jgi:hypothetical protein
LVARLSANSSKMNTEITRKPVNTGVHSIVVGIEYIYELMWYNLNTIGVFRCSHELIHCSLFMKKTTIKPLKLPNIRKKLVSQWTVFDEKNA